MTLFRHVKVKKTFKEMLKLKMFGKKKKGKKTWPSCQHLIHAGIFNPQYR